MSALTLEITENGVANLTFDLPDEKVNKLSAEVLSELENILDNIAKDSEIKILIIKSAKKGIFIAGADINEIKAIKDLKDADEKVKRGQDILSKIAQLKIPTISLINGACLGGGLEFSLACTYRIAIANDKTILGLPEVNLGILPGFGGTQRLPKLIGLSQALNIILSGKPVKAQKAYKIGLVDAIFAEDFITENLEKFTQEALKEKNKFLAKRKAAKKKRFIFENLFFGKHIIFNFAKKNLFKKTKGQYPAPFYALEVVKETYQGFCQKKGFKIERQYFCDLAIGEISKNLIDIFFTSEAMKKDMGLKTKAKPVEINNAALLGAGIMGGGIAWLFANKNIKIQIKDITNEAIAVGYKQVLKIFSQLKKIRKINDAGISMKMANITSSLEYKGFENADIVVEAVVENINIKKKILKEAEGKVNKDTIIVSNTSSLSISQIAKALKKPENFAGMHFFNPVNRMPLVEVIKGEKTSDKTIISVVNLCKKLGKTPIVVKDVPGFLVNRILLPCMNEACYLLEEGAQIRRVDVLMEKFGMPMGPFILADVVGIDVAAKVAHSLQEGYGARMKVAKILDEIYSNHKELLGKKSGKGFYLHNKENEINPQIAQINKAKKGKISDEEIVDRLILTMVNEAAKCLEEEVVVNAQYLDMAMIMGAGFPPFKGGLLKYADNRGIENVVIKLQEFNQKLGSRYEVSKLLIKMANNKQKFY